MFKKVVLIIRKEHQEAFEESLVKKIRPYVEVEYAYQDINDIPVKIKNNGKDAAIPVEAPSAKLNSLSLANHIL